MARKNRARTHCPQCGEPYQLRARRCGVCSHARYPLTDSELSEIQNPHIPRAIWAIGDIHGELALLETLLEAIPRGPEDITVFLGDYIDGGPNPLGVVQCVLKEKAAAPQRVHLLWGNHEDMAAYNFRQAHASIRWIEQSRNIHIPEDQWEYFESGRSNYVAREDTEEVTCPDELLQLFPLMEIYWQDKRTKTYFVHGGLPQLWNPRRISCEDVLLMLWYRPYDVGKGRRVICGHTPQDRRIDPYQLGDHLVLDTGCSKGGPLTALELGADNEERLWQAFPGEDVVRSRSLTQPCRIEGCFEKCIDHLRLCDVHWKKLPVALRRKIRFVDWNCFGDADVIEIELRKAENSLMGLEAQLKMFE